MAMTAPADDVSFSCPVIAPKRYIVKGPSGWTETFDRQKLDEELARYIHPMPPRELAQLFLDGRAMLDKPEPPTWWTIVGFIGRSKSVSPRVVPIHVGIAFWAHIELAKREQAAN